MELYIKHMVCDRCIMVVKNELKQLGLSPVSVTLGTATFNKELSAEELLRVKQRLEALGFGLIDDKRIRFTEQVKQAIIELVHQNNSNLRINLSEYLSDKLHYDYTYISTLFSDMENVTIEQYYIAQKIEKVKELLIYDEMTLTEIAYMMNYSSVAYLSTQFKRITGFTPSQFKSIKGDNKRKSLDKV